jgi:hypothetical protein
MACFESWRDRAAGGVGALQEEWSFGIKVGKAKSDAIHRDPIKGRKGSISFEVFAKDAMQGVGQRDRFGGKGLNVGKDVRGGFLRSDQRHAVSLPIS